jgi:hypothetical protein
MTLTKEVKDLYEKNFKSLKKEIKRRSQKMKRSPMLMDWQDQYSKNGYLAKSNLQIQCNPHQNSNSILQGIRKSNLQIHLERIQQFHSWAYIKKMSLGEVLTCFVY